MGMFSPKGNLLGLRAALEQRIIKTQEQKTNVGLELSYHLKSYGMQNIGKLLKWPFGWSIGMRRERQTQRIFFPRGWTSCLKSSKIPMKQTIPQEFHRNCKGCSEGLYRKISYKIPPFFLCSKGGFTSTFSGHSSFRLGMNTFFSVCLFFHQNKLIHLTLFNLQNKFIDNQLQRKI